MKFKEKIKNSKKLKVAVCIFGVILLLVTGYLIIHMTANNKLLDKYANGFEKNRFDTYCKNIDDNIVISMDKASVFKTYTNISISNFDEGVIIIVWVPLFKGEETYGVIVSDYEKGTSAQIEVDKNFKAYYEENQKLLDEKSETIDKLKNIANKECGLNL